MGTGGGPTLTDVENHGTCVSSVAVGTCVGVAKLANLMSVKYTSDGAFASVAVIVSAFMMIMDRVDWLTDGGLPFGKYVINISSSK